MRHLSVVEAPQESPPKAERMLENQRTSQKFLEAFYINLEESKKADADDDIDFVYTKHTLAELDAGKKLTEHIAGLGENEAIHVAMPDVLNHHTKHVLAVRRTEGTESIFTFIALHCSGKQLVSTRVQQEIIDTSEAFNSQIEISFDTRHPVAVDYIHTSRVGRFYDREDGRVQNKWDKKARNAKKKKALELLDRIVGASATESVDKVVSTSITKEEDRIRANLQGKSTAHALASAVIHFPDFVRQQKAA